MIRVVTDSTADLPPELAARLGVIVVPLHVHFDDKSYLDGVTITKEDFYRRLEAGNETPRTSQPSPGEFQQAYETLADADGIVSIHLSGKLSGTLESARSGAALRAAGPHVEIVDSHQASMGIGFAVVAAAERAAAGGALADVAEAARSAAARSRVLVFVDTLDYLVRGGRIGRAKAFLGTLLRTKPLLELRDGEIEGIERPRTRQRAAQRLAEMILRTPHPAQVVVLYGSAAREAEALAARLRPALPDVDVSVTRVSPVLGVHVGPSALGAAILRSAR